MSQYDLHIVAVTESWMDLEPDSSQPRPDGLHRVTLYGNRKPAVLTFEDGHTRTVPVQQAVLIGHGGLFNPNTPKVVTFVCADQA